MKSQYILFFKGKHILGSERPQELSNPPRAHNQKRKRGMATHTNHNTTLRFPSLMGIIKLMGQKS